MNFANRKCSRGLPMQICIVGDAKARGGEAW
jgi:hypothetical protein